MSRPAVLFVLNYLGQGSVTRYTLALIVGLRERYDFHIACIKVAGGPGSQAFEQAGAKVITLPAGRIPNIWAIPRLAHYIRAHHIQVVHTQVLGPDVIGGISARIVDRTVLISTKHNMHYIPNQGLSLLRNLVYWPAMYLPDQVITVSKAMRSEVLAHLRLPPERVAAIHIGIDVDSFNRPHARVASRESLALAHNNFVLIYSGRLTGGKGLECLVEAVRQVAASEDRIRLAIVGDGPLEAYLRELVLEAGLTQHVIFTGFRLDIPNLLAAADVFVLPSLTEGLPLSIMEAMAAGKAVVATSVGGIPELVEHEFTGLLLPPNDPQALARVLLRLVRDPALCDSLGANGHAVACSQFGAEHMIKAHDALYQAHLKRERI